MGRPSRPIPIHLVMLCADISVAPFLACSCSIQGHGQPTSLGKGRASRKRVIFVDVLGYEGAPDLLLAPIRPGASKGPSPQHAKKNSWLVHSRDACSSHAGYV